MVADPTDETLIGRLVAGDVDALGVLYDRHGRSAFGLAFRLLGDRARAEDVTHDAFLAIWRHADAYDPARGRVRAWLLTAVRNRCLDILRDRPPGRRTDDLEALPDDGGGDPFESALSRLQADAVRAALAALPDEQREVIVLAYFDGLTHVEIAARSGLPLGTVKGRLRLGLVKLGQALLPARVA